MTSTPLHSPGPSAVNGLHRSQPRDTPPAHGRPVIGPAIDGSLDERGAPSRLSKVVVPDMHCTQPMYRQLVARRLRTVRVLLEINQQELADAAGVSRNFISAVERGAQGLDVYRISLVATALQMPLTALLTGDGWDVWIERSFRTVPSSAPR